MTPKVVEQKIDVVNKRKYKRLIVDIRDNGGGGFDQRLKSLSYLSQNLQLLLAHVIAMERRKCINLTVVC